ncbi:MAG: radical SAM family heme chaperone HemW [Sphaerochaeta sp.]|nr:radical SAM family heme chaperone HemW [Sphaerochaeta sp.]
MLPFTLPTPLSLYIHIPFCTTCCSYCAFYSEPKASWIDYKKAYVDRLEKEILTAANEYGKPFSTIFFGGGNPGCLDGEQLSRLLQAAQIHGKSKEVTIEMNPETFNPSFFPLFEQGLITRLSVGIQSMDDSVLKILGRNARRDDNIRGIAYANQMHDLYGTDLSFDLMACLPGQTLEMAISDINELVSLSALEHISLYCLTVEEGTELSQKVSAGLLHVMNDDEQEIFLFEIWKHLEKLGFRHYEISNFCKKGHRCEHNLHYWSLDNYLGLGSSAASTLFSQKMHVHVSQDQSLQEFSQGESFTQYVAEQVDTLQQLEEFLMMALRTDEGIDKSYFLARFNRIFDQLFSKTIDSFENCWYENDSHFFVLTEVGFMVLDEIVVRFALAIS